MRTGPRPLALHVGMAASIWGGGAVAGGLPATAETAMRMPELQGEAARRLEKMLRGIRTYQEHPYTRNLPPLPMVWSAGTARLFHAKAPAPRPRKNGKGKNPAVLLIPSLVNGSSILDLTPDRSFLRWLGKQGFESYLLDWGKIVQDPALKDLDGAIGTRLAGALAHVADESGGPVHVVGYCMGGLLALALERLHPRQVRSLVLLASPWEFAQGPQPLGDRIKAGASGVWAVIDSLCHLPVDGIQALFASVDPLMAARKFSRFADFAQDGEKARIFVAVEDWLNDGLDLPAAIARECIKGWYIDNEPARGAWRICEKPIRAQDVACPALVVASGRDRLVPFESAAAAARQIPAATLLRPDCGHIGMMAGEHAVETIWSPVAKWMRAQ